MPYVHDVVSNICCFIWSLIFDMAYVNEDSICSAGGLSPIRSQAITLNNADYWCNLNKKDAYIFLHENVFKMSSAKCR